MNEPAPNDVMIIGIDCAAQAKNVGLAKARWSPQGITVEEARNGHPRECIGSTVAGWAKSCRDRRLPVLLALDAPLGWPDPLSSTLSSHRAGAQVIETAPALFRRMTDYNIKERLGKMPLAVGADRIAWVTVATLKMLQVVRLRLGEAIPLAWSKHLTDASAIEVYPAATKLAHAMAVPAGVAPCEFLADELASRKIRLDRAIDLCTKKKDVSDALICLVAADDFLHGRSVA
nr:DUF429 domain-containing protein [Gemmatimonadota bacterium]